MHVENRETLKQSLICAYLYKAVIAILLFVPLFVVSSTRAQAPFTVDWQEERLSVTAEKVPLAQILHEVARLTGVEIRGLEELQEKVSVRFANLSLREGLQKLLAQVNYFLLEKTVPRGGTQPTLVLVSGRQTPSSSEALGSKEGAKPEGESVAQDLEDLEKRLAALDAFAEQGNEEALRQAAADPNQAIQAAAFALLARQNPAAATTLAAAAARGLDFARRLTGLQVLGQLDNPLAVQTLGEALADEDVGVRKYAIQSLEGQTTSDATRLLSHALKDQDPSIRVLALQALAAKGVEGREALESALNTRDPLVRSHAAELLQQMKADEEIPTAEDPE
jgi:hypothetical protein